MNPELRTLKTRTPNPTPGACRHAPAVRRLLRGRHRGDEQPGGGGQDHPLHRAGLPPPPPLLPASPATCRRSPSVPAASFPAPRMPCPPAASSPALCRTLRTHPHISRRSIAPPIAPPIAPHGSFRCSPHCYPIARPLPHIAPDKNKGVSANPCIWRRAGGGSDALKLIYS